MGLFIKKEQPTPAGSLAVQIPRNKEGAFGSERFSGSQPEAGLYDGLRKAVPVIDAAIGKIVRLCGGFRLVTENEEAQKELDEFSANVQVGLSGKGLQSFSDGFLDSLLTYGCALGEIILNKNGKIAGLCLGDVRRLEVRQGSSPIEPEFYYRSGNEKAKKLKNPELLLFTALNPTPDRPCGRSLMEGLPYISGILMRIYECIGQNFDRAGNVRYAVTYHPKDSGDKAYAKERAQQIAKEWSEGMQASRYGQVRDFVAAGDVDIKVIGAESPTINTDVPVRQLLEQIAAKLSIPPFLLGLNWTSTERMSSQQADILTSELEYFRRLLTPVLLKAAETHMSLSGWVCGVQLLWDNINLQDESELAEARLKNAQAKEIEDRLLKPEKE